MGKCDERNRALTEGELLILELIREMYGEQNTREDVFFTDRDEAAIFVKDQNGVMGLCAVLTNLAAWYADGTISSIEELKSDWLRTGDS
jgi:hypothetical protein